MEPFGIAAIVFALVVGLVGLMVGWWVLRRALSMLKKLIVVGLLFAITAGVVAAAVALALAMQFNPDEDRQPPAPIERQKNR